MSMVYWLNTHCPAGHAQHIAIDLWRAGRRVTRTIDQHGVIVGTLGHEDGRVLVRWQPEPKEAEWVTIGELHVEPEQLYCTECNLPLEREG